ncbi:DUF922 domain-containing protein [Chitinibacteraceae bacterium HSL-7]
MSKSPLLLLSMLLAASAVHASVYRWTDEHGNTVYSDRPPAGAKGRVVDDALRQSGGGQITQQRALASDADRALPGERFRYYTAAPAQPADVHRAFLAVSSIRSNGRTFLGYTRWDVRWRFGYRQSDGQCAIRDVRTELDIEYTMPRLADASRRIPAVQQAFDRLYVPLLAHERGHAALAREAEQVIQRTLAALPPMPDCDALGAQANAEGKRIVADYAERNRAYDHRTDHGRYPDR